MLRQIPKVMSQDGEILEKLQASQYAAMTEQSTISKHLRTAIAYSYCQFMASYKNNYVKHGKTNGQSYFFALFSGSQKHIEIISKIFQN